MDQTTTLPMDPGLTAILGIALVLLVALAIYVYVRQRRAAKLRSRFGAEYPRAVHDSGNRKKAEAELREREHRVKALHIEPLSEQERTRFIASWRQVQAEFVDAPQESVTRADQLLRDVMTARGYPVASFERRCADLSVDYPGLVQNYRAAQDIAARHRRGEAGTEELRQAIIHYRALFAELIGVSDSQNAPPPVPPQQLDGSHYRHAAE